MMSDRLLNMKDGDIVVIICAVNSKVLLLLVQMVPSEQSFNFIDGTEIETSLVQEGSNVQDIIMSGILQLETANSCLIKNAVICVDNAVVAASCYRVAIDKGAQSKFTQYDVDKITANAIREHTIKHPFHYIIDLRNSKYLIDNQMFDPNLVGIEGRKVESQITIFSIPNQMLTKILKDFERYKMNIVDLVPSIFSIHAVQNERNIGQMIIQIEDDKTSCLCSKDNCPFSMFTVDVGTAEVDRIISKKYNISMQKAKKNRLSHADVSIGLNKGGVSLVCHQTNSQSDPRTATSLSKAVGPSSAERYPEEDYIVNVGDGFSRSELSTLVRQSVRGIMVRVKERLRELELNVPIDSILITGTGSKIKGINSLCRDEFRTRVEVDNMPVNVKGEIDEPISHYNAYIGSGVAKYVLQKHQRLKQKKKNKGFLSLIPNKVACFLEEIL